LQPTGRVGERHRVRAGDLQVVLEARRLPIERDHAERRTGAAQRMADRAPARRGLGRRSVEQGRLAVGVAGHEALQDALERALRAADIDRADTMLYAGKAQGRSRTLDVEGAMLPA